jgi:hypothetical protein
MREYAYGLTLYREVGQVHDKVVFEVRREGRIVGYAYGTITKDEPEYHAVYKTRVEAEAAAAPVAPVEPERPAAEAVPQADKKPRARKQK